ncbi:hypothetical protein LX32DRAFT_340723 [Colletotrichum zoysiae]|uniref:Uncharacterized protein n=1 Tax=Colletotrichum zoysiae TaxID=1216348 RepID=A0AAD9HTE8_9PEZI|nr:hypothetical protein LX32DRAFT_340723 [Colletotrichum zoysiae]
MARAIRCALPGTRVPARRSTHTSERACPPPDLSSTLFLCTQHVLTRTDGRAWRCRPSSPSRAPEARSTAQLAGISSTHQTCLFLIAPTLFLILLLPFTSPFVGSPDPHVAPSSSVSEA